MVTKKCNQVCNNIDLQTLSRIDNKIQLEKNIYFYYEARADAGFSVRIKHKHQRLSELIQPLIYITLHSL